MAKIMIKPGKLRGEVVVPPSKSLSHRAIICASLAGGTSRLRGVRPSVDVEATIAAMRAFGASIAWEGDLLTVDGSETFSQSTHLTIDCKESGSTLRFLVPLALHSAMTTFVGSERLGERPLDSFYKIFEAKGIAYETTEGRLPLTIKKGDISGEIRLSGGVSSQFLSGLLFSLPLFPNDSVIFLTDSLESRGYVDLTLDSLSKFGIKVQNDNYTTFKIAGNQQYKSSDYTVEGDFSQAAFFLAAGSLGSDVLCHGLAPDSLQGDREIINIIRRMGGEVEADGGGYRAAPRTLRGIEIDVAQTPDLVPILAVLGCIAEGETVIYNAARLRIKECDRLAAITTQLNALGGRISEETDQLIIHGLGGNFPHGGKLFSCNDHRIAMASAIAATCTNGEVEIDGAECVAKSYPTFWADFESLGGLIDGEYIR